MGSFRRGSAVVGAMMLTFVIASAAPTEAQRKGAAGPQMRPYDAATEVTLQGTVTDVKNVNSRMGGRGMQGTHILVATGSGVMEVHLGPSWYLDEQKIVLAPGDAVTVVGSRVTMQNADAVIARRIATGKATWTLRDDSGRPLWAGRGRGPR